jgi:N-acetylglucosamine-6-phosphate deacetylase
MNMTNQKPSILIGPKIYTENTVLENSSILIENGIIKSIGNFVNPDNAEVLEFPPTWHLIPGMIDMHIHGANGADVMDATPEALSTISNALLQEGVTAFLATTISESVTKIEKSLQAIAKYVATKPTANAEILGINLEGPFLSANKPGCQKTDALLTPDISLFQRWQKLSGNLIKITTIAPETINSLEFIKYLKNNGIIAACGHSNATYAETIAAINAGCTQCTHLFNAMRNIRHREPGIAGACLLNENVYCELIADGIHIHPAMLELAFKLKGPDKIILVTDAIRAKYFADGTYELGGQEVIVKGKEARLKDGTLAGSVLRMDEAMRNMIKHTGCSLLDITKMTSANPAKQLNIFDRKGSIAIGKDADLVALDESLHVRAVFNKYCSRKI